jgi:hypothetical protein
VRLKLDENIPASAVLRLSALGLDVDTVLAEGLQGRRAELTFYEVEVLAI